MKVHILFIVLCASTVVCSARADEYLAFTNPTDTISIAGNTVLGGQGTYEAIVSISSTNYPAHPPLDNSAVGDIFNAVQNVAEDERFGIGDGGTVFAYAYPVGFPSPMTAGSLSTNTWHDIAYVYDGTQQRIYVDGSLVGEQSSSGNIGAGGSPFIGIGAILAAEALRPSFIGDIKSLRISDVARYYGSSYDDTMSDFPSDDFTRLLYDFDQLSPGSTTIPDLSGFGNTGTLGVGFEGATSPTIVVPEPSTLAILPVTYLLLRRRRVSARIIPSARRQSI